MISFGVAKLLVVAALASAYLHIRYLGIPFFTIAGVCLIYSIFECVRQMEFVPLFYRGIHD